MCLDRYLGSCLDFPNPFAWFEHFHPDDSKSFFTFLLFDGSLFGKFPEFLDELAPFTVSHSGNLEETILLDLEKPPSRVVFLFTERLLRSSSLSFR